MAQASIKLQKNKGDNVSISNSQFPTASREYDKTSNVPSKNAWSVRQEKQIVEDNNNTQKNFISNIKSVGKESIEMAASSIKGDQTASQKNSNTSRLGPAYLPRRSHIDTGKSALRGMEEIKLRDTEYSKRNDFIVEENPFVSKENSISRQSKLGILAPSQKSQMQSKKTNKKQNKIHFEEPVDSSKALIHNTQNKNINESRVIIDPAKSKPGSEQASSDSFEFKPPQESEDDDDDFVFKDKFNISNARLSRIGVSRIGTSRLSSRNSKVRGVGHNNVTNKVALERILEASNIYHEYLSKNKRASIFEAQIQIGEKSRLPQEFYYRPERLSFTKSKSGDFSADFNHRGSHIICKMNQSRTKFYFQDLSTDQLKNMKGLKCNQINIPKDFNMSQNVQYDQEFKRFYLYSNTKHRIYIFSQVTRQALCYIPVTRKVRDPHLFLHKINDRKFLIIVGGYNKIQKSVIQGSKYLEIFQFRKWDFQVQSRVIKTLIGRISPIVLNLNQKGQSKLLIIGGNTIASIDSENNITYEYEEQTNESTNQSATSIASDQILEYFDIDEPPITKTHPVRINDSVVLHDGCVMNVENTILVLLPKCKNIIEVKAMNKQITLVEGKTFNYIPYMKKLQRKEVCMQLKDQKIIMYKIDERGHFQTISQEQKRAETCSCLIF